MQPIKLYVGESYREEGFSHVALMYPFWGVIAKESTPYFATAMKQYQYSAEDFTLVSDIKEADFVFIPYNYLRLKQKNPEKLAMIIREAREAKKLLLIDNAADVEHPIDLPNSVVMRAGQFRYALRANEITVPWFVEDLLESYFEGTLVIRQKTEKPSVSFAGWAWLPPKQRLRVFIKELPITIGSWFSPRRRAEHKGVLWREKVVAEIERDSRIDAHFTVRKSFSGHVATAQGSMADNRKAFVDNLINADYALAVRGDPNSSYRFYEALGLGRIPLVLNTACVFPLEQMIDYSQCCVFVDHQDLHRIGDILLGFHRTCTPEKFIEMQKKAREIYVDYLRADAFSKRLAAILREKAQQFYAHK